MGYLLDTNVCIEILRGRNSALKTRLAAIAQTNGLTLVTHNTGEFTRVPTLPVEDWQA
ncbi:MAG: PIN domain-containing protein [Acidithiobacillus sp.]